MPKISLQEFEELVDEQLPFAKDYGFTIDEWGDASMIARAPHNEKNLRPGGTIAGPVMMGLADFAIYAAVLGKIGRVELAVTTNFNINFLRRPKPGDMLAKVSLLKLGRRLAVAEVGLFSDGSDEMVAHVTSTYSIPPAT